MVRGHFVTYYMVRGHFVTHYMVRGHFVTHYMVRGTNKKWGNSNMGSDVGSVYNESRITKTNWIHPVSICCPRITTTNWTNPRFNLFPKRIPYNKLNSSAFQSVALELLKQIELIPVSTCFPKEYLRTNWIHPVSICCPRITNTNWTNPRFNLFPKRIP